MKKAKKKSGNQFAENFLVFMSIEAVVLMILYGIPNATGRVLTGLGMTLSYYPFALSVMVIVTISNFYINMILPVGQKKKGLIR